jgi:predicted ATPase
VVVITGFLGTGKTTLVRHLLLNGYVAATHIPHTLQQHLLPCDL